MNSDHVRGDGRYHSRFEWVVRGKQRGPLRVFDEPLAANDDGVTVPSLGSIVPGWTLLIPRHASPNFAALGHRRREALNSLRREALVRLGGAFEDTVYEFEHGPANIGGILGCGVDQAHSHLVPLQFDLVEATRSISGTVIEFAGDVLDPWELVPSAANYFLVRNPGTGQGVVILPTLVQSQAIRRIIAARTGSDVSWDYRQEAGIQHAVLTQLAFISYATSRTSAREG